MEQFMISVVAILPFVLYLTFGFTVRKAGITNVEFLRKLNALNFTAFFPCLAFDNMYSMDTSQPMSPLFFGFAMLSLIAALLLCLLFIPRLVPDRTKVPVLIQAMYRSNILLFALPLTQSLFGDGPVGLATAIVVIFVPFYNVAGVVLLETWCSDKRSTPLQLLRRVITNPLISGFLLGMVFRFCHIPLHPAVLKVIRQYSALTTPIALFILGGTLQFSSVRKNLKYIVSTLVVKLIVFPAVLLFIARLLGFQPMEQFILWILFAAPVATALFPMSQAMGGDGPLAGELVAISTLAFIGTSVLWLTFMQMIGMF